eukprot:4928047-Amphidinium_carterae.2
MFASHLTCFQSAGRQSYAAGGDGVQQASELCSSARICSLVFSAISLCGSPTRIESFKHTQESLALELSQAKVKCRKAVKQSAHAGNSGALFTHKLL